MSAASPAPSLSPQDVRDVAALLPDWLERVRRRGRHTGVQAAIWHRGELVTEVAVGPADEVARIPLRTSHRLRIASHSKMFCALTVMRLVEQGSLRLDDTLGERVPDLASSPVADRTLRDLLSHSAGLTRDAPDATWWQLRRRFPDREQLLAIAREGAVVAEPGVHLQYSNIGYGLLGLVIEEVTGQSFAEAVRELVIDPVGAGPLGPDLPADAAGPDVEDGFAAGHTALTHGERRRVEQIPTGALAAATGFWATAGAICAFAGQVLAEDGLLQPGTLRTMRRRVWTLTDGRHYGLGLQEGTIRGFSVIGHSGGFPTGLTRTWAVPGEHLAVSVLGTAIDAPSSPIAEGLLGLLSLASGAPAPSAADHEAPGALGGAGAGRERPAPLAEQAPIDLGADPVPAAQLAARISGTYETLWGATRLAVLGGRFFALAADTQDPTDGALELRLAGTRPDPIDPSITCLVLEAWGDPGYGAWAEPLLARVDGELCCTGLWETGQLLVPTADFELPETVQVS